MPMLPAEEVINAASVKLDPKEVVLTILAEDDTLRKEALEAGIIVEVKEPVK